MSDVTPDKVERELRAAGWVPTSDAARMLNNVNYRYVYYLTRRGLLRYRKLGGRRFYSVAELIQYLQDHPRVGTIRAEKRSNSS